uniref:N-acetyltransferase domain-containing protein n=1 Tax=Pleurostichidium falkenbergii TaxID=121064 RepID=A0A4D6UVU4_9FLOR|nr:hypothetical protein [Pleurostichidium falkenbergii]QCH39567.1 hypothetical protein [Pleurostichidium falkenbergii]
MTFWKFFFKSINLRQLKESNLSIDKERNLLIKGKNEGEHIYLSINKNINLYELERLCDSVGWIRRPLKKVKLALDNSFLIVSLFCYKKNRRKLIGFARVTSDGSFNATIWDVVIDPEFQGLGLGKALMDEMIKQLRNSDISTITLFADPEVIQFYKHIGFMIDPDGVKGMFWYPI